MGEERFVGGAITIAMVPVEVAAEQCVETLRQEGLQTDVEVDLPMSPGETVVVARVPWDSRPTIQDWDAAKARVLDALGRADITVDVRGYGFRGPRAGERA